MPSPAATVDPLPGLALNLNVNAVEETARGGVISLTLETTSAVQVETLSLVMQLPPHIVFADGSKEKTWEVTLDAGGSAVLPIDLLVGRPGRFVLKAEAIGTLGERTIRRGTAYPLVVGMSERLPEVKDGAIQYRGLARRKGSDQ